MNLPSHLAPDRLKIMIVGDSMTHGEEGDWTWRYRIWEWLQHSVPGIKVQFVGPYTGTVPPPKSHPPVPPRLPGDSDPDERDSMAGGYAKDVSSSFDKEHFSHTGRQMKQAKDEIHSQVSIYKPDMLLTMLGFNDLGWLVSSGADETLEDTKSFVDQARAANPEIHLVLGNIPQRSHIDRDDLVKKTSKYNALLHHAIPEWSTARSRIEGVEIERSYGYVPDECKGTFDGLHPNALGDYQIACAFSRTLHHAFGFGSKPLTMPKHIPKRPLPVPSNLKACGAPYGVVCTFDAVYGSHGYDTRQRRQGESDWDEGFTGMNRIDHTFTSPGEKWEFQVRASGGLHEKGEWSEIVRATAERSTAPSPKNVQVYSTPLGFEATWEPLDDSWNVDRYVALYQDKTDNGFLCGVASRGTSASVSDLATGHRVDVMMQTWTAAGPGVPEHAGTIVVGSGVFSRPAS
ncbi:hypothetical protein DOTSEDRAFT_75553 [Dothistroma septosporum NZE10]|uniref:SGNH hydrolase-type esterase domain-containing protein n=2 Tax=Dothistroma septosporum TaxID=64363 RepID=M2YIW4_DOTSN|nr:hypothetical protein [Dothistroma septosporum]EME38875.1 hypothetical protein DOTSEDRAFT_75553 [Dothistroma septosporum NZE10]